MKNVLKLNDGNEKSAIADRILRGLPEWFGIESALVEYVNGVKDSDFFAVYDKDEPIGFISVKSNNRHASEIYVIAVLKEFHHTGIGTELLKKAEEELVKKGVKFLMVKTLSDSDPDENYAKTREYYLSAGFLPLQEIEEIWGENNPCLIMVKVL
jgi:ribosomal protein S18 acetylase RimI-like enzyme